MEGLNYHETFAHVVKMNTCQDITVHCCHKKMAYLSVGRE